MHLLRLLRGRILAGTDRPDRLISKDGIEFFRQPQALGAQVIQNRMHLFTDHGIRETCLTLRVGFPHAKHRRNAHLQQLLEAIGSAHVAFMTEGTPLRMADDGIAATEIRHHFRRDGTGEGTFVKLTDVLCPPVNIGTRQHLLRLIQIGERQADGDIHLLQIAQTVDQTCQQHPVFGQIAVHLPVADDQWLSHGGLNVRLAQVVKLADQRGQFAAGIARSHGVQRDDLDF